MIKTIHAVLAFGIPLFIPMNNAHAYPISPPRTEGYLQVSQKHQIFYAAYGNPEGIPVVFLHGGPGIGCTHEGSRFFDLKRWNVIMFDQRGSMRSTPFASMEENTTQHSINDIEALRQYLGIRRWYVFGCSWGSCLALAYGEEHPEACLGFILGGIFLGREQDISFFKDMGEQSPEAYQRLLSHFSQEEQRNLPQSSYQKIMDPDPSINVGMARELIRYAMTNTKTPPSPTQIEEMLKDDRFNLSFARAFMHYILHQCFLQPDQILSQLQRISDLPAIIVHGSLDIICVPEQAKQLHQNWEKSQLWMVEGCGHSPQELGIASALTKATDTFLEMQKHQTTSN